MSELNLGSLKLPLNAATKTFALLAKRGAGKSYTGAVMAEEFYRNNIPFVVFDPIDVWWGLRFDKNGKDKGLPIVVFGLEHADLPLTKDMGKEIAQAIVKENISCVISTFGMHKSHQRKLITDLAEELLNINNTPRHIFIEEAHEFVPQKVFGEIGKTFNAVSNLVVMGRNRGLGVTLINQRASTINKDVLTQLDSLLAFRNVAPQDRKALKEWVEFHSAEGDFDKFMESLPSLPTGEGWIWSPEFLGIFERIKIRTRETFHPDREKLGQNFEMPTLTQTDVQSFIDRFKQTIKTDAKEGKISEGKVVAIVEEKKDSQEVIALRNEYESKLLQKDVEIRKLQSVIQSIQNIVGGGTTTQVPIQMVGSNLAMWLEKLGTGAPHKILKFLAEKSGLKFTKSNVALGIGLSPNNGNFDNALGLLRRNNLIIKDGDSYRINPDL